LFALPTQTRKSHGVCGGGGVVSRICSNVRCACKFQLDANTSRSPNKLCSLHLLINCQRQLLPQLAVFNLALNAGPGQQFIAPNQSMTASVWGVNQLVGNESMDQRGAGRLSHITSIEQRQFGKILRSQGCRVSIPPHPLES